VMHSLKKYTEIIFTTNKIYLPEVSTNALQTSMPIF
jgi:hypothetical protein